MSNRRGRGWRWGLVLGAATMLGAGACAPQVDTSPCDENRPCEGRGLVCDLDVLECVDAEVDLSSTESPAPSSFTNKIIPFFRGEMCLPHEVQSGADLPVVMRPCLHPCIAANAFEFRHSFSCVGSRCDALAMMWVVGSSASACPADAFGSFDSAQCVYGTEVEFSIATATGSGPISGTMTLEAPFLSNADMEAIAANPTAEVIDERVQQYPQQQSRIPNGQSVSLLPDHPVPPASCSGGACPCYPVGF